MPPRGRVNLSSRNRTPLYPGEFADQVDERADLDLEVLKDRAALNLIASERADQARLVHRGAFETVDIVNRVLNPDNLQNLVEFEVPAGYVARINAIGIFYSEPVVAMSTSLGWRVMINLIQVPNIGNSNGEFNYSSFGDISNPMEISPLFVQAGETVAIQIEPVPTFNQHLVMVGRLSGRLISTGEGV